MTATPHSERTITPRVRPADTETKAALKTTELMAYVATVVAIIITAAVVSNTDNHADYFRADKAMFYIVLLTLGYMVSRGLAKSGSREPTDTDHH